MSRRTWTTWVAVAAATLASVASAKDLETIDLGEGVTMEFVLIRPGAFVMGSAAHEPDEGPAHRVTLTRPFQLGKFEVTQAQWTRVMGVNPSHFQGANRPVENVSWDDCQRFLAALGQRTGRRFALPTEAQWEYACRAGTATEYSWGDDPEGLAGHAWHATNAERTTHPVGRMKPNPWGLHDMHGNVYEWCADWYSEGSYPKAEASDPPGARSGRRRVLRGGAWLYVPDNLRSGDRAFAPPDYRTNEIGLRCVLLEESAPENPRHAETPPSEHPEPRLSATAWSDLAETLTVEFGPGVAMEFVLIKPGTFTMGSEASRLDNEKPARRVTITQPFYLGRYEVTQRQWDTLMERSLSSARGDAPPTETGSLPVDNVSWALCQSFLARLNEKIAGRQFRLPTEAEWEYACRAGTTEPLHFDEGALNDYAWIGGNSEARAHRIGGKRPNGWGLHDMYGNVWEWCEDRYGPYAGQAVTDPVGVGASQFAGARVLRGGAWNSQAMHVTSTFRHEASPGIPVRYYGFRCAASMQTKALR